MCVEFRIPNSSFLIPNSRLRYDLSVAKKQRLDVVMAERGLAPSRSRAQALVIAGKVRVEGEVESKAGTQIAPDAEIERSKSPVWSNDSMRPLASTS